uniref:R13L1/DRL21-like LRR repeat region domain-containing protein n=1 Tax=Triticum urartu TaxID=4572 RepID=A0A8R7JVN3_TRIUA
MQQMTWKMKQSATLMSYCHARFCNQKDLIDKVTGSDYFRIENGRSQRQGWKGDVPRDVRHLFVRNYDAKLITEKILELENLRTLIIYVVEDGTRVEEKVIESICKMFPKLRVLAVAFSWEDGEIREDDKFSVPKSISLLKHLRYFSFRMELHCTVILPRTLTKLHHIQVLDFGDGKLLEFTFADPINLGHIFCSGMEFPNIGRLRDLNMFRGSLSIHGLENVESKEEALEANLAAKERLTNLELSWGGGYGTRCSPEIEAEVLEGLWPVPSRGT